MNIDKKYRPLYTIMHEKSAELLLGSYTNSTGAHKTGGDLVIVKFTNDWNFLALEVKQGRRMLERSLV